MTSKPTIIPKPAKMEAGEGSFELTPKTVIWAQAGAAPEARYLAKTLAPATGFELQVSESPSSAPAQQAILFKLAPELARLGEEGYQLSVDKELVVASAPKPAGLFYAGQSLLQLLPAEILSKKAVSSKQWTIPCVKIEDQPRFAWRGHLFDVGRHFFTVDEVKRAIDLMAFYKLNRLHWHLTEDQGWRIEIKRYPELTRTGSWRTEKDGSRYGGFYTQDQVRDIVAYAAERHVTVVPEIELPGHSSAALTSYPELGCTGGPYKVANGWGVFKDVYCAGQDQTFTFLENVLDEVLALFPSQYIHIGGDECPKDSWKACPKCQARIKAEGLKDEHELQSFVIRHFDKYLAERGRRLIGWDEILEGGLAPGAVVQSWRGIQGGIDAANSGHDVIMSPTSHCYIDYSYATISLPKAYEFEPVPAELDATKAKHVLGLEGNMWTEHVPNQDRYDFQVYPRMIALAEVAWSPKEAREWKDFSARMEEHNKRLQTFGVKYGIPEEITTEGAKVIGSWKGAEMNEKLVELEWDATTLITGKGAYEVLPWYTSGIAGIEIAWAALLENGKEIQRDTHEGWSGVDKRNMIYRFVVKNPTAGARYAVKLQFRPIGGSDSNGDVFVRKVK